MVPSVKAGRQVQETHLSGCRGVYVKPGWRFMLSVVTLFAQGCVVTAVGKTWLAFVRGCFSLVVTRRVSKVSVAGMCLSVCFVRVVVGRSFLRVVCVLRDSWRGFECLPVCM